MALRRRAAARISAARRAEGVNDARCEGSTPRNRAFCASDAAFSSRRFSSAQNAHQAGSLFRYHCARRARARNSTAV
jgi:hypothetical protein